MFDSINWLAVVVSALAMMVVGFVWYGPLFGKAWIKCMGMSASEMEKKKKGMGPKYMLTMVGALVSATALAMMLNAFGAVSVLEALKVAVLAVVGFVATVKLSDLVWGDKPVTLYLIDVAYHLVSFSIVAKILNLWK